MSLMTKISFPIQLISDSGRKIVNNNLGKYIQHNRREIMERSQAMQRKGGGADVL